MPDFRSQLQDHFGDTLVIERELSGGGMSQVVLARDVRHERRVVIKLLPAALTAAISAERFEREILVSAALQHPNIVPVLSSGKVNGSPYFVMPFIEGESVRARVRRGPMSVRETVNVLKDVTRALIFAHDRGVIHRDIKPDNVLLSAGAGAAVVTDFGVAKAITASRTARGPGPTSGMTGAGITLGTPAYMAPEQAAADPNVDHRADLYALGILGYEMLAGAPPFHGRSPQQLLAAQMTEAPAPLYTRRYDVPRVLNDLLMRCLAKEPSRRPESAASLLRLLEDPGMVSGAFAAETGRSSWRRPLLAVTGVIVLAVAGLVGWRSTRVDSPAAGTLALGVLPFRVVGSDQGVGEVGEALRADLAAAVSKVPGVRVASSTALGAAMAGNAVAPADLGRQLSLTHLVEGTVQRERTQLRVTVRLVRIAGDSTWWSASFDGAADSVLALQGRIAEAASAAVRRRP